MHLKVTPCVITVSPLVNSDSEVIKPVVLPPSSLFQSLILFRYHIYDCSSIPFIMAAILFLPLPIPYDKNSIINKEIRWNIDTFFTTKYMDNHLFFPRFTLALKIKLAIPTHVHLCVYKARVKRAAQFTFFSHVTFHQGVSSSNLPPLCRSAPGSHKTDNYAARKARSPRAKPTYKAQVLHLYSMELEVWRTARMSSCGRRMLLGITLCLPLHPQTGASISATGQ